MKSKYWCSHITEGVRPDSHHEGWILYLDTTNAQVISVPRGWKMCPVCGAERPTAANKKAARHRFLMDNDQ